MTDPRCGLVVIGRDRWTPEMVANRPVPEGLTSSESLLRYRGFDGEPWPEVSPQLEISCGLLPAVELESALAHYRRVKRFRRVSLLYLQEFTGRLLPPEFPSDFLGFDHGWYMGEDCTFSCILHEILFGLEDTLRSWATQLNEHLLFGSAKGIDEYRSARASARENGVDLEETDGEPDTFAVFDVRLDDPR